MPLFRKACAVTALAGHPNFKPLRAGLTGLATALFLSLGASAEVRDDGPVFDVSGFSVKYGSAAGSLPDIKSLLPVEVELGHSDSGWVDPASNPANDKQRLRIGDGNDAGKYHASAIAAITRAVLERIRTEGFIGVFVKPDPADIDIYSERDLRPNQSGPIRLLVEVGRVRELRSVASGNRIDEDWKFNNPAHRKIRVRSPIQPSALVRAGTTDVIRKRELEDYLFRVNRYPGRRVEAALAGGKNGDGIALDFHVQEAKPWFVYFQSSDTGTERTDIWQHRLGYVNRQFTDRDDILSLQYTNAGGDRLHAVNVSYEAPWFSKERPAWMKSQPDESWWQTALLRDWIPWWGSNNIRWNISANYSSYKAINVSGIDDFEGSEWNIDTRLIYQLFQYRNFFIDAFAGYDIRVIDVASQTTLNEGQELFFIPELGLEMERITETSTFVGSVDFETNVSTTLSADTNNLGRSQIDADWKVVHYSVGSTFYLEPLLFPNDWKDPSTPGTSTLSHEISLGVRGQQSLGNRLPPQELGIIGGTYSVRGYEQSIASGDNVLVASAEYRFHLPRALPVIREPLSVPLLGDFRAAPQMVYGRPDWDLVFRGFIDYGRTERVQLPPPAFRELNDTLLGAGAGIEFRFKQYLTVRADWGRALKSSKARDDAQLGPRVRKGQDRFHLLFSVLY